MFNEFKFSRPPGAARRPHRRQPDRRHANFPADFCPTAANWSRYRATEFTPKARAGVIKLPWDLVASLTGQYVERAPKPAELFSRRHTTRPRPSHIGNPNLQIETAKSIKPGRGARQAAALRATAYYTRFNGFIFRQITGVLCGETFDTCGTPDADLNQAVYAQRDATFRGGEFASQLDVAPLWTGVWGVESQFDVVRATFTDGTNVPRIPPVRVGGGAFWRDANWLVRVNLLHAFAHTDVEVTPTFVETPTAGYNLLRAEVSYRVKLPPNTLGPREMTMGVVGDNLLNDDTRNSVSFTKDEVLLPGRDVLFFANDKF